MSRDADMRDRLTRSRALSLNTRSQTRERMVEKSASLLREATFNVFEDRMRELKRDGLSDQAAEDRALAEILDAIRNGPPIRLV